MSYSVFELSTYLGKPVILYRFTCGNSTWLYTAASRDFTYNSDIYVAIPIKHGKFEITQDSLKSDIAINMPRTIDVVAPFVGQPPENVMYVKVYRIHKGDTEAIIAWQGRVTTCSIAGDEATLKAESLYTSMRQPGLVKFSRQCRHVLYGTHCGLVAADHSLRLTGVLGNGSRGLTHAGLANQADGWWVGGYAMLDTGERRMITSHSGTSITLAYAFSSFAAAGAAVTFCAGCDLTVATCNTKFANVANFGGFPDIPEVDIIKVGCL